MPLGRVFTEKTVNDIFSSYSRLSGICMLSTVCLARSSPAEATRPKSAVQTTTRERPGLAQQETRAVFVVIRASVEHAVQASGGHSEDCRSVGGTTSDHDPVSPLGTRTVAASRNHQCGFRPHAESTRSQRTGRRAVPFSLPPPIPATPASSGRQQPLSARGSSHQQKTKSTRP